MASTTIWTFRCPVSTCNFSTHVPKNRLLHSMFCRLGEAFDPPQRGKVMHFNCPECGRSYTTKGSMKRHQNLTHGVPLVMVAPCSTPPSVWLPGPFLNSRFRSQVILVNLYFDIILTTLPFFFVSNRDSSGFLCLRSTTLGFCLVDAPDVRVLIYEFTRIPLGCPTPTNARGIRSFTSDLSCYFFLDFSPNYGMSLNLDPSVF